MRALTKKQEAFSVASIKADNLSDAYRSAYDTRGMTKKQINEEACKLAAHPKVARRITELRAPALKATGLTVERTLLEVRRVSEVDPRRFYREDGTMKAPKEWDDDMAAAVASVEATPVTLPLKDGETEPRVIYNYKIKFWDKNAGLEKSMKHLGLFEKDNAQTREHLTLKVEQARPVRR